MGNMVFKQNQDSRQGRTEKFLKGGQLYQKNSIKIFFSPMMSQKIFLMKDFFAEGGTIVPHRYATDSRNILS